MNKICKTTPIKIEPIYNIAAIFKFSFLSRLFFHNTISPIPPLASSPAITDGSARTFFIYNSVISIDEAQFGIKKEEIPKIFGRFYRSLSVADQPGVGVGLFLAREIIQAQKGYVKVKSEIGKGSTFSVFLPV